jgi:hypothetical protein
MAQWQANGRKNKAAERMSEKKTPRITLTTVINTHFKITQAMSKFFFNACHTMKE